ncbi:MAG: transporter substrate-binding domain-containing protein, partial [Mesorhizobium sp.]
MIGRSVIVPFRWIFLALLSALIGALPFADATRAAEPQVPVLWDAKERLPKPDLSALPRLRFLTTTDFPPFNFLDGSGRLSGFHIDLARAICAELGIVEKCQIQALPWNDLDDALRKGEGEAIIAGIAATPESREKYAFSRSYLQFPARFIMPKAKAFTEPILDKLRSKRVGVIAGSAHEEMLRDYFSTVQVVPFDKPEDLYADLKAGRIDAAFGDGMRFAFWLGGSEAA